MENELKLPYFWQRSQSLKKPSTIVILSTKMQYSPDTISYLLPQCLLSTVYPLKQLKHNKIMVKESSNKPFWVRRILCNEALNLEVIAKEKEYYISKKNHRKNGKRKQDERSLCLGITTSLWKVRLCSWKVMFLDLPWAM